MLVDAPSNCPRGPSMNNITSTTLEINSLSFSNGDDEIEKLIGTKMNVDEDQKELLDRQSECELKSNELSIVDNIVIAKVKTILEPHNYEVSTDRIFDACEGAWSIYATGPNGSVGFIGVTYQ